jgi:GNAT superfamily N-acetyltransferase
VKNFIKDTLRKQLLSENYSNNKFTFSKSPNGELITLYSNDQMVGDIEIGYSDNTMEILQLDILTRYRGNGYAKLLMNKAINHATKKGLSNIVLEPEPMDVNGIDKAGLYDFYSKFGFIDTNDGKMELELNKRLNENEENVSCLDKFGKELFGDQFGGHEKNTRLEDEYVKLINQFGDNEFGVGINSKLVDAIYNLKKCASQYPEVLIPDAEIVYRGSYLPLSFFIKNGLKISQEGIDYTYTPRTPIQSWTSDEKIAEQFTGVVDINFGKLSKEFIKHHLKGLKAEDNFFLNILPKKEYASTPIPVVYVTKSNEDFIFKHKYFNILTGENEDEVIRVSSNPIEVKLKVNPAMVDVYTKKFIKAYNDIIEYGLDNGEPYKPTINEGEDKTIKCKNCGWTWKESESAKEDLYLCHKCGYDNTPRNINESIVKSELVNIDDDDLYDSLDNQANTLRSTSEISFGSADPFEILYDDETGRLVGATWIETSGAFSPHMIIDPEYRKMGLSQQLIDGVVEKYKKMKHMRGDNYTFMLNVVNNSLADTMEKHYGFKKVSKDAHGNITMTL